MKEITLAKNKGVAIVDDEWYPVLSKHKWHLTVKGYAARCSRPGHSIMMHQVVNMTPKSLQTDHINGNKLDNRASNLRSVTASENCQARYANRPLRGAAKRPNGKFQAGAAGMYLGVFDTAEEAAAVAARKRAELGYLESAP